VTGDGDDSSVLADAPVRRAHEPRTCCSGTCAGSDDAARSQASGCAHDIGLDDTARDEPGRFSRGPAELDVLGACLEDQTPGRASRAVGYEERDLGFRLDAPIELRATDRRGKSLLDHRRKVAGFRHDGSSATGAVRPRPIG
jgi:hypothetical protein